MYLFSKIGSFAGLGRLRNVAAACYCTRTQNSCPVRELCLIRWKICPYKLTLLMFQPGPSGFAASGTASTSQPSGQPSSVHPPTVRPSSGSMARGHPPSVPRPPAGRPPHNPPPPPPSMVDTKPSLGGVNSRHLDGDRIRSEVRRAV